MFCLMFCLRCRSVTNVCYSQHCRGLVGQATQPVRAKPCVHPCCGSHCIRHDFDVTAALPFSLRGLSSARKVVWMWHYCSEVTGELFERAQRECIWTMRDVLSCDTYHPKAWETINKEAGLRRGQRDPQIDVGQPAAHHARLQRRFKTGAREVDWQGTLQPFDSSIHALATG